MSTLWMVVIGIMLFCLGFNLALILVVWLGKKWKKEEERMDEARKRFEDNWKNWGCRR